MSIQKLIDPTMFRFLISGVLNTMVGCGTMFLLYNLAECSYWFSSAANYIVGSVFGFFLNKHFTFQNHERNYKQAVKFVVNVAVCYFVAYGAAKPIMLHILAGQAVKIQENLSLFVGMCFYVILSYCGQRFFVFNSKETQAEPAQARKNQC